MKTIVHLSDLHFGRVDHKVLGAMAEEIAGAAPDIVVVSGDMTQRARTEEFVAARAFLDSLPVPWIGVPGNHDVPLYNVFKRAFLPLSRYRRHIASVTEPFWSDDEIAICGVNTARSLTIKDGRINRQQLALVEARFESCPQEIVRIVVTHHPFEGPSVSDHDGVVGRARLAVEMFSRSRVDMVLSGHLHLNRIGSSAVRYAVSGYAALLIQAGTAISARRRDQSNSFNLITVDATRLRLECRCWDAEKARFFTSGSHRFRRGDEGWSPDTGEPVPTVVQTPDAAVVEADSPHS